MAAEQAPQRAEGSGGTPQDLSDLSEKEQAHFVAVVADAVVHPERDPKPTPEE